MIVIDASVLAVALADDSEDGRKARAKIQVDPDLHAPHLVDLEVLSVLRGLELGGKLPTARLAAAAQDLSDLRISRYPHHPFTERILQLRKNLTVYDAAYVALAEALNCSLLTADKRLAKAPGVKCQVEIIRQN